MERCIATTRAGHRCGAHARYTQVRNYCGTHHNSKMQSDDEYRTAFTTRIQQQQAAQHEHRNRQERAEERRREIRRTRNERLLTDVANTNIATITKMASRLMNLWNEQTIPGYDCVYAYAMLTYVSPRHIGFEGLLRAVIQINILTRHHIHTRYTDVPIAERNTAHTNLHTALAAYGDRIEPDPLHHIQDDDRFHTMIQARIRRERQVAEAAAAAAALAAAQARAAAERAQAAAAFQQADRERPVVFQRDPEGGIDLRAFATDTQSVHRSSVQNTTQRVIEKLLERPVPEDQATVFEITIDLSNPVYVGWRDQITKLRSIDTFTDDYFQLEAFSVKYADVVDRIWAFIRGHRERVELTVRLAQEICEGIGMCANGKMARMVNVLQGYDESLDVEPPREMFQSAIAALMKRPLGERETRARELFREYQIPAEEHDVWLEPLLEDDTPNEVSENEVVIIEP
jgi:hypothetical protein